MAAHAGYRVRAAVKWAAAVVSEEVKTTAALKRTHSRRSASSRICQNADRPAAVGHPRFDKRGYKAW
jgi:hypothetical protein